jgi:DNA polymerase III alpha subunit
MCFKKISFLILALLVNVIMERGVEASSLSHLVSDVSRLAGVPAKLLEALVKVETGVSSNNAWPWTIQVKGKSYYFKNKEQAVRYASTLLENGLENFDVGLAQVNYRWHGDQFASLHHLMTPRLNLLYAAKLLKETYLKTRSWEKAIKLYHSSTPSHQEKYWKRVSREINKKGDQPT